jgi:hypothetical protein
MLAAGLLSLLLAALLPLLLLQRDCSEPRQQMNVACVLVVG